MITVATAIVAASVFFFLVPSTVSVGSISGLAIVISNFIPLPISAITLVLNVVLLIIGFIFIGKEFGGKTVFTSVLLPAYIRVFEKMDRLVLRGVLALKSGDESNGHLIAFEKDGAIGELIMNDVVTHGFDGMIDQPERIDRTIAAAVTEQ